MPETINAKLTEPLFLYGIAPVMTIVHIGLVWFILTDTSIEKLKIIAVIPAFIVCCGLFSIYEGIRLKLWPRKEKKHA